ncbi:MAG: YmdB family metallophosphoesterase [Ruminococcaceae bacterium]|nr:YmdB family metallophosphoesterase [Oscillospiraceae bacterium]
MRILAIGDIVGDRAVTYLEERLRRVCREKNVDFVIANAENAAEIRGLNARQAERLFAAGVDAITLGNHAFGQRDLYPVLEEDRRIIRPANFPPQTPGMGYTLLPIDGGKILIMNVCGRAFMEAYGDPFASVENILKREAGNYGFSVLDVHAEATSEKLALARRFDGRINIIFGTHTHVPTADEQILPKGTAYQTDLGMTGPIDGVLGVSTEAVLERFTSLLPTRFSTAPGEIRANATLFTDNSTPERIVF